MFEAKFQSFGPNIFWINEQKLWKPMKTKTLFRHSDSLTDSKWKLSEQMSVWHGLSLISSAMNIRRTVIFFIIMLYNPNWMEDYTVVNFRWDPSHSLRPASRSCCHNPGLHTFISDISSQCRIACSELYKVRQRRGSLEAPPQLITPPALSLQEGLNMRGRGNMWPYHPLVVFRRTCEISFDAYSPYLLALRSSVR